MPTMMRDAAISFPMLGNLTLDFPASFSFTLFGHDFTIYMYGIVMAVAFLTAVFYASRKAPRLGIKSDDVFSLVLWVLPLAIVGCRIYFVISEWDRYKDNLVDIFKIWEGGIAMYGGTIAGAITIIVWSKCKKIPFGATLDMGGSALILGQVIGRWANFVNREAFGYETDVFCRMGLTQPGKETVYVHPTFLYESLWNLVGFLIINFYWYKKDHRKYDGQIFAFYVLWYGTGRAMVEGLRTDSLYIPGTSIRTSQLVAACSAAAALIFLLVNARRSHRPTFAAVKAAAAAEAAGEAAPEAGAVAENTASESEAAPEAEAVAENTASESEAAPESAAAEDGPAGDGGAPREN